MLNCSKCSSLEKYKDGRCKDCGRARAQLSYKRDYEKRKLYAREWKAKNRERSRVHSRKGGRLDWKPGEHERAERALLSVTKCGCCGSQDPRSARGWNADHDHSKGLFRAHVCHPCNIAISHVERFGLDRGSQIKEYLDSYEDKVH